MKSDELANASPSKENLLLPQTTTPPVRDDFSVGTPLPNTPLADPVGGKDHSLLDIESIKAEKKATKSKQMEAERKKRQLSKELQLDQ
ncbi:unnamed protein product [Caenorhabditis angaria]|uniref:Uncharacterized protein n=1 Tax=Caenorhabditis angaria TaxID=860376 RepID=A0A9P1N425_9PELO|nr:unnamed protein product [Caenorhabditis angaria]